jgi:CHAD domain-containing protein
MDIQDYLKQEVSASKTIIKGLKKKPTKDLNHRLRVSIRRIRTVIQLLQNEGKAPLPKSENKILKKMWRHLGEVRDYDVSEEIAQKNELPVRKIKNDRKIADENLQKDLAKKDLKKLLNHLEKLPAEDIHPGPTIKTLRQRIKKLPLVAENMHAFRIILKKIRYLMEALDIQDDEFKKYQDVLGELNDLQVFLECQGESPRVRSVYKRQLKKAIAILKPATGLALRSLSKAERRFHHTWP